MLASLDLLIDKLVDRVCVARSTVPQRELLGAQGLTQSRFLALTYRPDVSLLSAQRQIKSSIEVAIVEFAVPLDIDGTSTHQSSQRRRVEGACQELEVLAELATVVEIIGEALDGHVGDGKERVEYDTLVCEELLSIVLFE